MKTTQMHGQCEWKELPVSAGLVILQDKPEDRAESLLIAGMCFCFFNYCTHAKMPNFESD